MSLSNQRHHRGPHLKPCVVSLSNQRHHTGFFVIHTAGIGYLTFPIVLVYCTTNLVLPFLAIGQGDRDESDSLRLPVRDSHGGGLLLCWGTLHSGEPPSCPAHGVVRVRRSGGSFHRFRRLGGKGEHRPAELQEVRCRKTTLARPLRSLGVKRRTACP